MQVSTQPRPIEGAGDSRADERGELTETIPVIHETVRIDKRTVETGRIQLHKTVREADHLAELLLKQEELSVERVPVGRVVDEAPEPRQEGDVLIVPVLEEVMVVEKRLVLREELHVRRKQTERVVRETVRLRTEEVTVEHIPATAPSAATEEA